MIDTENKSIDLRKRCVSQVQCGLILGWNLRGDFEPYGMTLSSLSHLCRVFASNFAQCSATLPFS